MRQFNFFNPVLALEKVGKRFPRVGWPVPYRTARLRFPRVGWPPPYRTARLRFPRVGWPVPYRTARLSYQKEPGKFRLIVHLSFPKGPSVNDAI
ncbi:hypothetical protein GDO81_013922 [Engystomops pustulosus]|uniref:Uncharacterized protein n=1 Tax=Engystomops pustulosus TaxID=76066 RepID=A0AAV7B6R5_ENGPU|nr:hypothetical protein GDO81_013922 [Engystomops pustulosus]